MQKMTMYDTARRVKHWRIQDKIFHFCIALMPTLCLINVPVLNISLGTVLLLMFIPHSLIYVANGMRKNSRLSIIPFVLFYVYMMLRADGSVNRIILCAAAIVNLWGMLYGSIQIRRFVKIIEIFALINVALIVLQTGAYYLLGIRIQYIPQALIHSEFAESYVFRESAGLFRPSALFLEPAHFSQSCCFALISILFPACGKANIKKALIIIMGCVLTTSGMGIALAVAIMGWYILFNSRKKGTKLISIFKWLILFLLVVILLLQIPFFQTAIQRVISQVDGYNAIRGRTGNWAKAIAPMRGSELWLGYGDSAEYPYYLAGLADTIYKYGLIGAILEIVCFLYLMFRKISNFTWCCCVSFIALFCVAHLTSFYAQVFYFGIVLADTIIPNGIRTVRIRFRGKAWKN